MKCDICGREVAKIIPFYYGFFKSEYEPEKWVNACPWCCCEFLRASNYSSASTQPLKKLEHKIKVRRK